MRECYRFTVSGRVQGVGFRMCTVDVAQGLGLDGWVRNLPDGRVEGVAAGDPVPLARLRDWLRGGPPSARVDALDWQAEAQAPAPGFTLRR